MTYKELKAAVLSLDAASFADINSYMQARIALMCAISDAKERILDAQQEALRQTQKKLSHEEQLKKLMDD